MRLWSTSLCIVRLDMKSGANDKSHHAQLADLENASADNAGKAVLRWNIEQSKLLALVHLEGLEPPRFRSGT